MKETKLIKLVTIVYHQKKAITLHSYLQKQYLKSDGLEFVLWEHIRKIVKTGNLNHKRLKKDYILNQFFDGDVGSLYRTSSRLYSRIKSFMIEQFLNKNSIIQDWLFRESIKTEKLPKNRLKELVTDGLLNSDATPKNDTEEAFQYFMRFHLNHELYQEMNLKNARNVDLFNKLRRLFNEYFIRYYENLETEKEQRQKMWDEEVIDLVSIKVERTPKDRLEILLSKAKNLEKNPYDFEFCKNELIQLVDDNLITEEKQLTIFSLIFNFANRQSIKGNKQYLLGNIEPIMYLGFEKQILYANYKLPSTIYINFLSLTASSQKSALVQAYADKYLMDVEEKDLQKARYFTDIFIAFYKKDYDRVVEIIYVNEHDIKIGFKFSLRKRIWIFLICSYYELNRKDALVGALQSFRRYIKGHPITETRKQLDYKFIDYTRRLLRCRDLETLLKVEADLDNEKNVLYQKWLKEKIKESHLNYKSSTP